MDPSNVIFPCSLAWERVCPKRTTGGLRQDLFGQDLMNHVIKKQKRGLVGAYRVKVCVQWNLLMRRVRMKPIKRRQRGSDQEEQKLREKE